MLAPFQEVGSICSSEHTLNLALADGESSWKEGAKILECLIILKSLLMRMKEEGEKAGLKLNIQKMKIMASAPITLW